MSYFFELKKILKNGLIFRDGSNGQNIILNREKNLLITIMSTKKDMKM